MVRKLKIFGTAEYLGQNQDIWLDVRFGPATVISIQMEPDQSPLTIQIQARITGQEGRYNLITMCLGELDTQYTAAQQEPPSALRVMTWELILNRLWSQVLAR